MLNYPKNQSELEERVKRHIAIRMYEQGEFNRNFKIEYVDCSFEERTFICRHKAVKEEMNPLNSMHGGIVTWLLDSSMGLFANAWNDTPTPTLSISVNFISAVKAGDEVFIKATLNHTGRSTVSATAVMYCGDRVCATAIANNFVTGKKY